VRVASAAPRRVLTLARDDADDEKERQTATTRRDGRSVSRPTAVGAAIETSRIERVKARPRPPVALFLGAKTDLSRAANTGIMQIFVKTRAFPPVATIARLAARDFPGFSARGRKP